jgi:hypothetical protein
MLFGKFSLSFKIIDQADRFLHIIKYVCIIDPMIVVLLIMIIRLNLKNIIL